MTDTQNPTPAVNDDLTVQSPQQPPATDGPKTAPIAAEAPRQKPDRARRRPPRPAPTDQPTGPVYATGKGHPVVVLGDKVTVPSGVFQVDVALRLGLIVKQA